MFNVLDIIFLNFTVAYWLIGSLITNFERHVPVFLIKLYRFGSFGHKEGGGKFFKMIEVPKSTYRHFYVFAATLSTITLVYMLSMYFLSFPPVEFVQIVMETLFKEKEPKVSAMAGVITLSLLTSHCWRRCYESHRLQVFARSSKINLPFCVAAYLHYTAVVVVAAGQAPRFCGHSKGEIQWVDSWTQMVYMPCLLIFMSACYEQYQSNVVLANLRKDKKTGAVVTEEHRIPRGRMFEIVSSPHRLCEIVLYIVMAVLTPTRTMFIMCIWVVCNQIQTAVHAHEWYKRTFKDYPKNRRAIFPYLL